MNVGPCRDRVIEPEIVLPVVVLGRPEPGRGLHMYMYMKSDPVIRGLTAGSKDNQRAFCNCSQHRDWY